MELSMMDCGMMESSNRDNVIIQMENHTMGIGLMVSLMAEELNHGLMEENMMECGKWASQQVMVKRSILMVKLEKESGKMELLLNKEVLWMLLETEEQLVIISARAEQAYHP